MTMHVDFSPHLYVLPESHIRVWDELGTIPRHFTLYGETALALRLGHRDPREFDFLTSCVIESKKLLSLPLFASALVLDESKDTLTVHVFRQGPVKLVFSSVPSLSTVGRPSLANDNNVRVASLLDIAGTKALDVQRRAEVRDYLDIHSLLSTGISLSHILASGQAIYGPQFIPSVTMKALCFFGDGSLRSVPHEVKSNLIRAVHSVDLASLSHLKPATAVLGDSVL
jgi:hypothetical protein